MNETLKAMRERRSTRKFKPDAVPREFIEQVVDAGLWAPSGMNRQSPIIVAVTNKQLRDRLSEANRAIGGWGLLYFAITTVLSFRCPGNTCRCPRSARRRRLRRRR